MHADNNGRSKGLAEPARCWCSAWVYHRVYGKDKAFSGQLLFPHNKMEMIIFKNRTQEDIKCLPFSQDCVYLVEVY